MELAASTVWAYAFVKAAYMLSVCYIFVPLIAYFCLIMEEICGVCVAQVNWLVNYK